MRHPVLSFNAGELSPLIDARSDIDKYRAGCRTLENMIPRIYGPAERRPGTRYIDTCEGVARDIGFIYSNSIAYILLLEDLRMYFYYDGGRVLDTWGRRLKIDTPYLAADLFELQYKQSNDVMWITHGNYAPRKLSRTSANSFSLAEITFTNGPFLTRNDWRTADGVTLAPSAITAGSTGSLTASSATFAAGHVGALFSVTQPRVNTKVQGTMTSPTTGVIGTSILVEGSFTFTTHGTWTGTIALQRSIDNSTWETLKAWSSSADNNVLYTGTEEEDGVYYRINVTALSANTAPDTTGIPSTVEAQLTVNSSTQTGICRVTGYTSDTLVSMTVLKAFASTSADVRWSEGAWNGVRGYPRCVTFFEDRAVYAGTSFQPQTVWFSGTGDFEDFDEDTLASSSFSLTMSSDTRNGILWISALETLIVGTAGGEWRIRSTGFEEPITPTNYTFKQQTTYGSKAIQALCVNDAILFVDSVGRKVREASYEGGKDKYVARDLSALAEHITKTGITTCAFQKNPDPILWCTRADGTLLTMTYDREQEVIGWARHPMKVGPGTSGEVTGSIPGRSYPTLQDLTAAEVPAAPSEPTETAAVTEVSDAAGLQAMAGAGKYYLSADIDLTGVVWTPIVNFSGVLDGRGFTISNLSINAALSDDRALFGSLSAGAEIYDVTLSNCTVIGRDYVGTLVATTNANATYTIKNVSITDSTVTGGTCVAPLVGYSGDMLGADIYNCTATGCAVNANDYSGGLLGYFDRKSASVVALNITNCSVVGGTLALTRSPVDSGGFIGYLDAGAGAVATTIHTCTSSMAITASITLNAGDINAVGGFAGYFAGWGNCILTCVSCSSSGAMTLGGVVASPGYIGHDAGFIGFHGGGVNYINCSTSSSMTIDASRGEQLELLGGFGGKWDVVYGEQALHCWATGAINIISVSNPTDETAWYAIGGFIGGFLTSGGANQGGTISRCWCTGDITLACDASPFPSWDGGLGGFIGVISCIVGVGTAAPGSTIANCYSWSSITITADTGNPEITSVAGFIGSQHDDADSDDTVAVTNCYCAQTDSAYGSGLTGQVPTRTQARGFLGADVDRPATFTMTACYFDTQTSGQSIDVYATGHLTDWMQTKTNYVAAEWDFDTIWTGLDDVTWDYSADGLGPNSVAVIPSTSEDEVWLVVARVIGGSIVRFLEQMQPRDWGDDQEDCWFLDAALSGGADADGIVRGLDHLEGEEVGIIVDGAEMARQTVTGGQVNVGSAIVSKAIVGLPFRYILKAMRFDLSMAETTKGSLKTFKEVVISFYQTLHAEYGTDEDHLFKLTWRTTEPMGTPPALWTGDQQATHEGGYSVEDEFIVSGDGVYPCTVRCLVPRIDLSGR